ncbi:MAG: ADP-glyceromanno-heptose 6-epimerase [Bacteroidia bacterium]|nr:ADP-glyceromanno-heptose 6-epimerase [Bacteroidia bacterium]MCX7652793.1 ADP-glyceromanno-heptose 6-epimerase [Bacteroidia bacterium]MDW8417214.1 ADP-glyceromanno-heptose 6-epimerase [Bacteroidia bacterium]
MIVITGAAGFIGSALVAHLNELGITELTLVDDFSRPEKRPNWQTKSYRFLVERSDLFDWLYAYRRDVQTIFHLGARTDTALTDEKVFHELNLTYSQNLWRLACEWDISFFYASSAATYGDGALGFSDDEEILPALKPLNPYAQSKHAFDLWVRSQSSRPSRWAGFKFFNVYGPNEYHKGRMASVVWHGYNQIRHEGRLRLFRSHRPDYRDGEQKRDFIYVKDAVKVLAYAHQASLPSGIYNLGTGQARSFLDLAMALFSAMGYEPKIDFIETPEAIRASYQYFTQAEMSKLRAAGYTMPFYSLEEGVKEYVQEYLLPEPRVW